MFKIFHLDKCPKTDMENGRGAQVHFVNPDLGTVKVDLHLNVLYPGGARGKFHHHSHSDNIYIVRCGEGELTVEHETFTIRKDDVIYIPAGMRHSLSNTSDRHLEIFEIYAPSGKSYDFIVDNH